VPGVDTSQSCTARHIVSFRGRTRVDVMCVRVVCVSRMSPSTQRTIVMGSRVIEEWI
jgi:hypothetical protein